VFGGAGTGKTILAIEKAKQLAAEGFETLLTSFNLLLTEHLIDRCDGIEHLTVRTFHDHCVQMARAADIPMPELDGNPSQEFWAVRLPELLLQALDIMPEYRFDAVVIDEAQDIEDEWMELLELCINDPENSVFYTFEDPSQAIFRDRTNNDSQSVVFELSENLRNTQAIHETAVRFYDGTPPDCDGPKGETVQQVILKSSAELPAELGRLLHRLVVEQDVSAEEIAVLSNKSTTNSVLSHADQIGAFELVPVGQAASRKVEFESVWRFKGLERPVVVLVEFRADSDAKVRYSAMTRARSHLVLIGTEDELTGFSLEDFDSNQ
jgi:superfamily I DNA/RNA helicase